MVKAGFVTGSYHFLVGKLEIKLSLSESVINILLQTIACLNKWYHYTLHNEIKHDILSQHYRKMDTIFNLSTNAPNGQFQF